MKKRNWISLTALCFILSLTVACGKNKSGGGSSKSSNAIINPIGVSTGSNQVAPHIRNTPKATTIINTFNNAINYRNNATDSASTLPQYVGGFTKKQYKFNIKEKSYLWGFLNLNQISLVPDTSVKPFQTCFDLRPTDDNSFRFKVQQQDTVNFTTWGCNDESGTVVYNKTLNAELTKILTLNNNTWFLYDAYEGNGYIELVVGGANSGPQFLYTIDTQAHTVFNPVAIQDLTVGKVLKIQ